MICIELEHVLSENRDNSLLYKLHSDDQKAPVALRVWMKSPPMNMMMLIQKETTFDKHLCSPLP